MDTALRAVNDPTRRPILHQLAAGEQAAGAIARRFAVSRPAISHHLGVLREAGLVSVRRQAQSRLYSLNRAAAEKLRAQFNAFWDEALPRLKATVEADQASRRRKRRET